MAPKPIPKKDAKLKANLDSEYGKDGGDAVYYAMRANKENPSQKGKPGYRPSGTDRGNKKRSSSNKKGKKS